jgi:hypothetical protein
MSDVLLTCLGDYTRIHSSDKVNSNNPKEAHPITWFIAMYCHR